MNEQKNNGRGVFYGVIGVATLVVAIIGATFAYFTATASVNNVITGNMATITFNLAVEKVTTADETKGGMIPMSNSMVEAALVGTDEDDAKTDAEGTQEICVDDNGNAVCQVYKISVVNGGSAGMFLDGYVTLTGGSGTPVDDATSTTTMRWAQAFCEGTDDELESCTTVGTTTVDVDAETTGAGVTTEWDAIMDIGTAKDGFNTDQILSSGVTIDNALINGNEYEIINTNYIRTSKHTGDAYNRTDDITSALVFNQFIAAKSTGALTDSTDSNETEEDLQVFYIVVWLSETGTNQTADSDGPGAFQTPEDEAVGSNFFEGNVTFVSAQGSEVTATFSGYTAVKSNSTPTPGV